MSRPIKKRQDIIEAAMKLFVEKGVEGTTTREIAELAQAGEGTMFRHYKSKEALAWEIFDESLTRLIHEFEESTSHFTSAKDKIKSMIDKCYSLYETDRIRCAYLLLVEHTAAHAMPADYRTPVKVLTEIIRQGQAQGEIENSDAAVTTALVMGAILRVPLFKYYGQIQQDLRELVETVNQSVWKMIEAKQ
jgi:AcrR family transcriptional regulator